MSYNAGNEQQNINTTQFTYDLNGNRTQKTEGGITTTYTYDDENRLVQVTWGSDYITYAYDPFGRRIAKTVNGVMTRYVYDQDAIIAAYDSLGNVTARYAHGLNIDEPLAVQQGSVTSFYHADGLGSIVALTNTSGAVVQTYSYDSFGNITPTGSITQPFTFTAREYDSETGLYFYRARYYDPKAGRFISKDPIGFEGGDVNLFAYTQNNPINFTDPLGWEKSISKLNPVLSYPSYPSIVQPKWKLVSEGNTPVLVATAGGKLRSGGIFCTCVWERTGYEKKTVDACGKVYKKPVLSIYDTKNNIKTTKGVSTQTGCLCANPNGEYQLP
jgi:RHS repeat-associated protein